MIWPFDRVIAAWAEDRQRRRERQALARLAQIVAQTASSYEIVDYRKRRAAAMKGRGLRRQREGFGG
jgi:hypothetical protein